MSIVLLLATGLLAGACNATNSELLNRSLPANRLPNEAFQLHEYPLVEQSSDNPNHPEFIERVPEMGLARRLAQPETAITEQNQNLAPFGYQLAVSASTPYTLYSLYQGVQVVQSDILYIWPVTRNAAGSDFLLPFETLDGARRVASRAGIQDWPGADLQLTSPPVFIGDRLAYAAVNDSQLSVEADGQVLYQTPEVQASESSVPGQLSTWNGHWALAVNGRVIIDGQDLNDSLQADHIFQWQMIDDRPFLLFMKDGLVHASYGSQILPYSYDAIVTGDSPETALFRPGSSGNVVWFFALRDGLWYYVEAGLLGE